MNIVTLTVAVWCMGCGAMVYWGLTHRKTNEGWWIAVLLGCCSVTAIMIASGLWR